MSNYLKFELNTWTGERAEIVIRLMQLLTDLGLQSKLITCGVGGNSLYMMYE